MGERGGDMSDPPELEDDETERCRFRSPPSGMLTPSIVCEVFTTLRVGVL